MKKLFTMKDQNFNPLQNYAIDRTIGQGTFGKVKLGLHRATGQKVAIKVLEKEKIENEGDFVRVQREIHILRKIRHPNIIQLFEIIESDVKLYLIMEYAPGGELFEHIVSKQFLNEREAGRIFFQLINSIEYIHELGIVHRDLKPENILLDDQKFIKVVDFGLSSVYQPGQKLKTPCGSPCYAAPEMVSGLPYDGLKTDIWSCGIILYAMICGCVPFEDPNTKQLYEKIKKDDFILPKTVSTQAADLLRRILQKDPLKRISINDIRKHDFILFAGKMQIPKGVNTKLKNFQDQIEIDQKTLDELCQLGVEREEAITMLRNNKHNCITTTYYLLQNNPITQKQSMPLQIPIVQMQNRIQVSGHQKQMSLDIHKTKNPLIQNKKPSVPVPETGGSSSLERIVAKQISERLQKKKTQEIFRQPTSRIPKTKSQEPVHVNRTNSSVHSKPSPQMVNNKVKLEHKQQLAQMLDKQKAIPKVDSATYVRHRSQIKSRQGGTERATERTSTNSQRSIERNRRLISTYTLDHPVTQPNERVVTDAQANNSIQQPKDYILGIQIYKNNIQNRFLIKQQQKRLSKQ